MDGQPINKYNDYMKDVMQIPPDAFEGGSDNDTAPDLTASEAMDLFKDLTQKGRILLEKPSLLMQIAEKIEQVFWLRDAQTDQILYVNPAFEVVWGRPAAAIYIHPQILIESVHPEDRVEVMAARPRRDRKPFNQIFRILRPDGSMRWIDARTFFLCDEQDMPFLIFSMAQDITGQKEGELTLRKALNRTREQFNLSHKMSLARKPVTVLNTLMSARELRSAQRADLLFFNNPKTGPAGGWEVTPSWSSIQNTVAWPGENSLYDEPGFQDLMHPTRVMVVTTPRSPRLTRAVKNLLTEAQVQTLVIFPLTATGDWLGCLLVFFGKEHHFHHVELSHLKILVDQATITLYNLHLLEAEEETRHEAERANEIKTEFLAMISHELRTPLTSIYGFTSTLLAEDVKWEPGEQRDFILTIQRESDRLQELIDHLLDLSRLEAGMLPIQPDTRSLQEVISDALPQLQTLTARHDLLIDISNDLPFVYVDATRVAQVLVNLVRNSATHAPQQTEISVSARLSGKFVQVNVTDHGPGIPLSEQKRVFEAFRRGKAVESASNNGAGLGLAICKRLLEAHGGRIWIKRKSPPGTTVCFTLPVSESTGLPDA